MIVSNSWLNGNLNIVLSLHLNWEGGGRNGESGVLVVGIYVLISFHDRKYPEAVAKEIRRYVFRMGIFSLKLRNFSQRSTSVPSFRVLLATKTRETIHPLDDGIQASQGKTNTTARQEIFSRLFLE